MIQPVTVQPFFSPVPKSTPAFGRFYLDWFQTRNVSHSNGFLDFKEPGSDGLSASLDSPVDLPSQLQPVLSQILTFLEGLHNHSSFVFPLFSIAQIDKNASVYSHKAEINQKINGTSCRLSMDTKTIGNNHQIIERSITYLSPSQTTYRIRFLYNADGLIDKVSVKRLYGQGWQFSKTLFEQTLQNNASQVGNNTRSMFSTQDQITYQNLSQKIDNELSTLQHQNKSTFPNIAFSSKKLTAEGYQAFLQTLVLPALDQILSTLTNINAQQPTLNKSVDMEKLVIVYRLNETINGIPYSLSFTNKLDPKNNENNLTTNWELSFQPTRQNHTSIKIALLSHVQEKTIKQKVVISKRQYGFNQNKVDTGWYNMTDIGNNLYKRIDEIHSLLNQQTDRLEQD